MEPSRTLRDCPGLPYLSDGTFWKSGPTDLCSCSMAQHLPDAGDVTCTSNFKSSSKVDLNQASIRGQRWFQDIHMHDGLLVS